MLDLKKYNQVIFDFDGVILDSNRIKSEAFSKSLIGENKYLINKFIDYHKNNIGISRFVKFEYFFKSIKKQKNYKEDLDRVLTRYSKLSYEGLLSCEEISGVRNLLKYFFENDIECFVVSGGEQNEVINVLKKRKMARFFKAIYGSPATKNENLNNIKLDDALYFGDARSDYVAANFFNIDFVYINGASEWEEGIRFCEANKIAYYKNFENI